VTLQMVNFATENAQICQILDASSLPACCQQIY
jgi:hypothetical protein